MQNFLLWSGKRKKVVMWADTVEEAIELQRQYEESREGEYVFIFQLVTKNGTRFDE